LRGQPQNEHTISRLAESPRRRSDRAQRNGWLIPVVLQRFTAEVPITDRPMKDVLYWIRDSWHEWSKSFGKWLKPGQLQNGYRRTLMGHAFRRGLKRKSIDSGELRIASNSSLTQIEDYGSICETGSIRKNRFRFCF